MRRLLIQTSVLLLSTASVACGYDNGDKERVYNASTPATTVASIDTDAQMTNLTSGVGMFVEYAAGGTWKVQLACDTATTKMDCLWDIYAYTPSGGRVYSFTGVGLEKEDYVSVETNGGTNGANYGVVRIQTRTTTDLDGVEFDSDSGEPVTFDVLLDGESYPEQFIYWMSNGAVVKGANTPIVELTPTTP